MENTFQDFTEDEYRRLLKIAKDKWEFIFFPDCRQDRKVCLWRHDVDVSVHRAYQLAKIEAEEGVRTTYFIHLHSAFYNAFEAEVASLIRRILELGHCLGLHFDPDFYAVPLPNTKVFQDWLMFEKGVLERVFQTKVHVFSLHNPDIDAWVPTIKDEIGGLVNAYSNYLRKNYVYISDSNGYWRFQRLQDVLTAGKVDKLHVLTHPVWWTSEPMSPRARISRCIIGRATRQHKRYDEALRKAGRKNIK